VLRRGNVQDMGGWADDIGDRERLIQAYVQCVETQAYHEQLRQRHAMHNNPTFLAELNKKTGN
jgi:hypothetical protein